MLYAKLPKIAKTDENRRFTRDGIRWNLRISRYFQDLVRLCYTTIAEAGGQFVPEAWSKENGDCVVWGESASLTGLVVKRC